jgi:hypothetical protein
MQDPRSSNPEFPTLYSIMLVKGDAHVCPASVRARCIPGTRSSRQDRPCSPLPFSTLADSGGAALPDSLLPDYTTHNHDITETQVEQIDPAREGAQVQLSRVRAADMPVSKLIHDLTKNIADRDFDST